MNLNIQFSPDHIEAERTHGAVSDAERILGALHLHLHRNPTLEADLNAAMGAELGPALGTAILALSAIADGIFMASQDERPV